MTQYPNDLPAWMRPRQRRIDWGLLFVMGIGLLLDWPLAFWPGLPGHTDAALFVARAMEVAESLRSGTLYTRWAADLHFGYGSPLFNYLAPLPHYLSGLHQLITDANPVDSIKLGLALCVVLAGVGMYQFSRNRYGLYAGLLAAVVFMTSTPIGYALSVQSGNLAALLSLALLPWTLWALDQLINRPARREWLIALLIFTNWSLADTRLTTIGLPIIAIVLSRAWSNRKARVAVGWLLGTAALLTSFFWLPALVERDDVRWTPLADDPLSGALAFTESLGAIPTSTPGVINPPPERGLGLGFSLTTLVGAAAVIITRKPWQRKDIDRFAPLWDVAAFGLAGAAALLVTTPLLADIWLVPNGWQPIRPYDVLLGLVLPALTLVAAQAVRLLSTDSWPDTAVLSGHGALRLALMTIPTLATSMPIFSSSPWTATPLMDAPLSIQTETIINAIGTLRTGLLMPVEAYDPATSLDRIVFNSPAHDPINPVANLLLINRTPLESRFTVSPLTAETNLKLDRFAFPGWSVEFNSNPAPSTISSDGLVLFDVFKPIATTHGAELLLIFGDTPIRYVAWFLTGVGLLLSFGRMLFTTKLLSANEGGLVHADTWRRADLIVLGIIFSGFFVLVAVLHPLPHQSSEVLAADPTAGNSSATGTPMATYPAEIAMALRAPAKYVPGSQLQTTLFWRKLRPISADWELIVRLVPVAFSPNATLNITPALVQWHPGDIPTSGWPSTLLIRDPITLSIPRNTAPGDYRMQVALAQCNSTQRLPCEQPTPILPKANPLTAEWLTLPDLIQIELPIDK